MSTRKTPPPSPQGMGPMPSPRSAAPGHQRAASDTITRPSTAAGAPRRGPGGWLRATAQAPAVEPSRSAAIKTEPLGSTQSDPTALAYQVLEQFVEEGRRSMQRWMRPLGATPPVDISRLGGPANLEAIGRIATDALALLSGASTRPTRASSANVPAIAASPITAPSPSPSRGPITRPSPSPITAPPPTADQSRGSDGRGRPAGTSTIAAGSLAPAGQRNAGEPPPRPSEDEPVRMAPRAELRRNGSILGDVIRPANFVHKRQPLTVGDSSWGPIVKLL